MQMHTSFQNPCLTDEDLAKHFSVSSATIRLDRQTLGIPQMRERMEQLVFGHPSEYVEGVHVLDLDVGVKGVGLFRTTSEMADSTGAVAGDKLYGKAEYRSGRQGQNRTDERQEKVHIYWIF